MDFIKEINGLSKIIWMFYNKHIIRKLFLRIKLFKFDYVNSHSFVLTLDLKCVLQVLEFGFGNHGVSCV